jgi:hypothetical protein
MDDTKLEWWSPAWSTYYYPNAFLSVYHTSLALAIFIYNYANPVPEQLKTYFFVLLNT